MADPLSITASIIAVLQAGSVVAQGMLTLSRACLSLASLQLCSGDGMTLTDSLTGLEKLYAAKQASKEVQKLRREIERLDEMVKVIYGHLERQPALDPHAQHVLMKELTHAENTVNELEAIVKRQLSNSKTGKVSRASYLWVDLKGQLKQIRERVSMSLQAVERAMVLVML